MPLTESRPDALAEIYAQSIYELADSLGGHDLVEQVLGELEDILELCRANPDLSEFLSSRVIKQSSRSKSLDSMFKGNIHDITLNFLHVLNEKGRLGHLIPIVSAFDERVQRKLGRVEVDLYTASPMDSGELAKVKEMLNAAMGREAIVHPYTEPAMIGGVRLQIGDRLIDASIQTRLRKMRDRLADTGAARLRTYADDAIEDSADPDS
ncbi:MAG TPA: ATP synthase F1 subunit delta [Phycisphaerales bacterium]|nr:ATP synthase F1 subunit delta [Phycisphaerales bacterium]